MTTDPAPAASSTPPAWWRVGMVWLVLAGPLAVVLASAVTFAVAVTGAEPVLSQDLARDRSGQFADRPAVQARNHAATGQSSR